MDKTRTATTTATKHHWCTAKTHLNKTNKSSHKNKDSNKSINILSTL